MTYDTLLFTIISLCCGGILFGIYMYFEYHPNMNADPPGWGDS